MKIIVRCSLLALVSVLSIAANAAHLSDSLKAGKVELKSAGPLAFGPEGILFVADPLDASVYAIATDDTKAASSTESFKVEAINEKIAALLGATAQQIQVNDLAVNPISRNACLSVSRGQGPDAAPVLVRVEKGGKLTALALDKAKFSKANLPDAPAEGGGQGGRRAPTRRESITDIAFKDGKLLVAGLSNEEWSSALRSIPFPFSNVDKGTGTQIYHGAHGAQETWAPVRTFVPYEIKGETHLVAAYTCTPLVKFPLSALKPGAQVKGTTIAELGNRNRPLDMIVYQKGGKDYILMANSSRGVMKVTTDHIDSVEPIVARVDGTKGLTYETIADWKGITQLDKLDKDHALVLRTADGGAQHLESIALP
ncbi:MAG: hypothetical protein FJ403_02575 [Verrucomicrobia bacterium]|nr:hypothetical protein [Verrucomicrobiota bacterium]